MQQTLAKERQLMEVQQTLNDPRGGGGGGGTGERYPGTLGGLATGLRAGVGGIVQRPYKKTHGFCVFWDYITGLPKRSGSKLIGKVPVLLSLGVHSHLRRYHTSYAREHQHFQRRLRVFFN